MSHNPCCGSSTHCLLTLVVHSLIMRVKTNVQCSPASENKARSEYIECETLSETRTSRVTGKWPTPKFGLGIRVVSSSLNEVKYARTITCSLKYAQDFISVLFSSSTFCSFVVVVSQHKLYRLPQNVAAKQTNWSQSKYYMIKSQPFLRCPPEQSAFIS